MTFLFMLAVLFCCYMFPFIVAIIRGHRDALAIGAVNFFFGWTVIGFFGSLIWALTGNTKGR